MDTADQQIASLQKENEDLKKVNAVKSDLISISAHQLRTSLSALKWILKMFVDHDLGTMTKEQDEYAMKAYDSNERMIDLVNNLLTLNHTDGTSIAYNFTKVDIDKLIEETLTQFSGESRKKEIPLVYQKEAANVTEISCDPSMIRVVLQNLIENGIKYSNKNDKVTITLKYDDNMINISVHDDGIGIDTEDESEIFGKFFRTKKALEKDPVGSGLGLYTTKNIVERHKGKIWFESKDGEGTTFFVSLPIN